MKRIIFILMFFLVVSCSKDIPNPIVGTWALVDYTAYSTELGRKLNAATGVESWTFRKSGSAYVNGGTPMSYEVNGNTLSLYNLKMKTTQYYQIEELTEYTLKVYWRATSSDNWYTFTKMAE